VATLTTITPHIPDRTRTLEDDTLTTRPTPGSPASSADSTAPPDHTGCFAPATAGQASDGTAPANGPVPGDYPPWVLDPASRYRDITILRFDPQRRCWVLDYYDHLDEDPENLVHHPGLTSPDDLLAAQQWIRNTHTAANQTGITYADEPSTWTITEWRHIEINGRAGWMPLYDTTHLDEIPFPPRSPYTGSRANPAVDNQLRVLRDRGASPMHPLGTALLRGTPADIRKIAYTLAVVMKDLPHAVWLVPDSAARVWVLADYLEIHVEHAIVSGHGHVDILREYVPDPLDRTRAKGITAAAVWLYQGPQHPPIPHYQARLRKACHRYTDRFAQLDAMLQRRRPTAAHHHLAALAVVDYRRRQHLAGLLLRAHLTLVDAGQITAIAHAADRTGRAFYRRHGFRSALTKAFPVAPGIDRGTGAMIWPCRRPPIPETSPPPPAPAAEAPAQLSRAGDR
jgi:hypothetical protein